MNIFWNIYILALVFGIFIGLVQYVYPKTIRFAQRAGFDYLTQEFIKMCQRCASTPYFGQAKVKGDFKKHFKGRAHA
jgi:hypothetical protein